MKPKALANSLRLIRDRLGRQFVQHGIRDINRDGQPAEGKAEQFDATDGLAENEYSDQELQ